MLRRTTLGVCNRGPNAGPGGSAKRQVAIYAGKIAVVIEAAMLEPPFPCSSQPLKMSQSSTERNFFVATAKFHRTPDLEAYYLSICVAVGRDRYIKLEDRVVILEILLIEIVRRLSSNLCSRSSLTLTIIVCVFV